MKKIEIRENRLKNIVVFIVRVEITSFLMMIWRKALISILY